MNLNNDSQCSDEGYVKSCPEGKVPDENNRCPHNKSYFKCRDANTSCDDGYSKSACNSTTQVQTASYTNEAGSTCYQCRDKTCSEGGYTASITSCQNGTAVSFANKTCYKDVSTKTCENGGYKSSIPTNNKCDSTTYCSKTCYTNCKQPTCEESGFLSTCPTNHTCDTVTSGTYGRTCYKDKGQPTCEDGGYKSGVPTNQVCTPVSYSGRTCYQNCYQPQCSAGGYLDACPTDQSGTPVTYYGRNCVKDCSDNEVEITCQRGSILYEDKKCYSSTKKTPIAVVFDTTAKRAIALNEVTNGPLLGVMFAGYASSYAPAGVRGWQYPLERDLNGLKDIQGTLNTALESIGATPINGCYVSTTPDTFPLTAPINPNTSTYIKLDLQYKIVDLKINSGSTPSIRCLKTISGFTSGMSTYLPIRLVLPYGDGNCGAYKFNITSQELCDYEILNGNLCYKDCVTPTCGQGGFFTSCNSEWESQGVPFYGNNCYRCTFDVTCEDGGYYTEKQDDLLCLEDFSSTIDSPKGTITYKGLNCYECTEKPNIGGGNGGTTTTTCEDLGYLTPGSTAACACTYGNKPVTATTSSGTKLNCVRCGTYAECGGSLTQCIKCAEKEPGLADTTISDTCPGGTKGSTCACGGIHSSFGITARHPCLNGML